MLFRSDPSLPREICVKGSKFQRRNRSQRWIAALYGDKRWICVDEVAGRKGSRLLAETFQESQMEVLDRIRLDIRQEFLPIALHRFNFASFADEVDHETVPKQILVAETVRCQRNIGLQHIWVKVVQRVLTLPGDAQGVPRGRDAGSANVKSSIRRDEAVLVTHKGRNVSRKLLQNCSIVNWWP